MTGCATNRYQQFYRPYVHTDASSLQEVEWLKEGEEPHLYQTDNLGRDFRTLRSKKYLLIGYSSFNDSYQDENQIKEQARRVGATLVLTNSKYTDTETSTKNLYIPTTSTTYHSGSFYGSSGGGYSGASTTRGSSVIPVTTHQRRYDQHAYFFVKSTKKLKFGVILSDLSEETKVKLKRNTGVLVDIVVEDSPAFYANILSGDVLVAIDEFSFNTFKEADEVLRYYDTSKGQAVLKIIRDEKEKDIVIKFN